MKSNGAHRPKVLSALETQLRFFGTFLKEPNRVGAVAPSSSRLCAALCGPARAFKGPRNILEVGAGTGAATRQIGKLLTAADRLDICEISDKFADILERDVLSTPDFAKHVKAGRVRLLRMPVQELPGQRQYDFILSGLPLTSFELRDVEAVFEVIRRVLKPGGVFSYFEYMWLRRTKRALTVGPKRQQIREVSNFLTQTLRRHRFAKSQVYRNFPPAYAHHLKFDEASATK